MDMPYVREEKSHLLSGKCGAPQQLLLFQSAVLHGSEVSKAMMISCAGRGEPDMPYVPTGSMQTSRDHQEACIGASKLKLHGQLCSFFIYYYYYFLLFYFFPHHHMHRPDISNTGHTT